jgi:hypothetical protein
MTEYFDLKKDEIPESKMTEVKTATLNEFLGSRSPHVYMGFLTAEDPDRWMKNYLHYCRRTKQVPMEFLIMMHEGMKSDRY